MNSPRIVLLTGNGLRHRYVARRLAESTHLVGVLSEAKAKLVDDSVPISPEDRDVMDCDLAECAMRSRAAAVSERSPDFRRLNK